MRFAPLIKHVLPRATADWLRDKRSAISLAGIPRLDFETQRLGGHIEISTSQDEIADPLGDVSGGVGIKDRRALYSICRQMQPGRVLEIGTHVGASTFYLASALLRNGYGRITTVDILDLENPRRLCAGMNVEFVVCDALSYMRAHGPFDFVFLDGDHSAGAVYQEVSVALKAIAPGGYIILHDYYAPGRRALGDSIIGPQIAMQRIAKETNGSVAVHSFGASLGLVHHARV